jgi:5-methylthioadenosine/S-adenosylhomocysteine deaminase
MLFSDISLIDENFTYQEHRYVGVKDGIIAYVGTSCPSEDFGEVYQGRGKVLMPGMFNAHAHAPMTLLRGYAENTALDEWLNKQVFPFEAKITGDLAYPATLLAIAEMLRFGTVSFSDMYYHSDDRARAVGESGIKCNMCEGLTCFDDVSYQSTDSYALNERLIDEYHRAFDGRLLMDLCVHAEYTTTPTFVRTVAESAKAHGLNMHVHLSETKKEHEECKQRHNGMTPAAYFAELGVFDQPTTAAHCVWIEGDDFKILADKGVTVATNPVSNLKLGSGIADEPAMREAGIRVALGTDGVASNNNHNMFKDMFLLSILHKGVSHDPVGMAPEHALRVATLNGALSQSRTNTGVIAEGKDADLIVLDIDVPWMWPVTDMVRNLVYSAQGADVVLTMVDGRVLYRDGEYTTIDVERARFETQKARDIIVAQL